MKSRAAIGFVAGTFLIALAMYGLLYYGDGRLRVGRGPWEVQFTTNLAGEPMLVIAQPALGIAQHTLEFAGESLPSQFRPVTLRFADVQAVPAPVPFGRWIYHDLMYLPGVVTFDLFPQGTNAAAPRHEVELLPAALYINRVAHDWRRDTTLRLAPVDKRHWPMRRR